MKWLDRLFHLPPNVDELVRQHDVNGLIAALGHKLPWIRRAAAQRLGQLKDPQFFAMLSDALNDSDAEVRKAARVALVGVDDGAGA